MSIGRRTFVSGIGASPLWGALDGRSLAQGAARSSPPTPSPSASRPASPNPTAWCCGSRLAPQPLQGDGGVPPVPVPRALELAEDEGFNRIAAKGEAVAAPEMGHAVHAELRGCGRRGPAGFTSTRGGGPAPGGPHRGQRPPPPPPPPRPRARRSTARSSASPPARSSRSGYYAAYRHMAAEALDLILFLGDYIYEGDPAKGDACAATRTPSRWTSPASACATPPTAATRCCRPPTRPRPGR